MSDLKQDESVCGIYMIQGIKGKSKAKIKHLQNIIMKLNQRISDTLISNINVTKNVIGYIYSCNLTNSFIQSTKKLPVMYIDVWWDRSVKKKLLYRLFLYFTITQDINNVDQLINQSLKGTFSFEVLIDNESKPIDTDNNIYKGNEETIQSIKEFVLSNDMKNFHDSLIKIEEDKLAQEYQDEFEQYKTIPKATINLNDYDY
jgi:hypothetical protein